MDNLHRIAAVSSGARVGHSVADAVRRAMLVTSCTCLALAMPSCSSAGTANAQETRVSRLIAEEITLVDKDGKPWLRIGPHDAFGFQGLQLLAEDGDPELMLGILQIDNEDAAPTTTADSNDPVRPSQSCPFIRMYSPKGDGDIQLFCTDTGASLLLSRADETSLSVGVDGDRAWIRASPCLSFSDSESQPEAKPGATAREIELQYTADTVFVIITARDGTKKRVDLRALIP